MNHLPFADAKERGSHLIRRPACEPRAWATIPTSAGTRLRLSDTRTIRAAAATSI